MACLYKVLGVISDLTWVSYKDIQTLIKKKQITESIGKPWDEFIMPN